MTTITRSAIGFWTVCLGWLGQVLTDAVGVVKAWLKNTWDDIQLARDLKLGPVMLNASVGRKAQRSRVLPSLSGRQSHLSRCLYEGLTTSVMN